MQEEIVVFPQKCIYLIPNKYQASINCIFMHLVGPVESFSFDFRQFLIQFLLGFVPEKLHACIYVIISMYKMLKLFHLINLVISYKLFILQLKIMSERAISDCDHKFHGSNCKKCGIYNHHEDPALKTNLYDSFLYCSASKYLKHMRKRQCEQLEFKQVNNQTYALLQSICEKFQYTIETLALGIYIYAKTCQKQEKDQKFWASASLIVASKGIQLDKRVPYLNRYQRYADKTFSQEDYELAEKTIFQQINFDIQYTTFISFLHFYLTNGFIFKSDIFHPASLRYVEDDVISRAKDFLKTGEFLHHNPQKLALSIVKEIRTKFRLSPWVKQLQTISGFAQQQIPKLQRNNILKPLNNIYSKNRDKLSNVSLNSNVIQSLQSSLNMTEQRVKQSNKKGIRSTLKKLDNSFKGLESTLKSQNLKENSIKVFQQAPLATLRSNVLSANKHNNNFLAANNQKAFPLNSFISSRRI